MTNQPIIKLRDGALSVSIWKNQSAENGPFYSATFGRTYTDEQGQPKTADSFSASELLRLAHLCGKAYDKMADLRAQK